MAPRTQLTKVSSIKFAPVAPLDHPITDLALTPKGAALLTTRAKKLTKGDLLALNDDPRGTMASLHLSVEDVNSIKKAFSSENLSVTTRVSARGNAADISVTVASCCTPCCCAAAVQVEVAIQ